MMNDVENKLQEENKKSFEGVAPENIGKHCLLETPVPQLNGIFSRGLK